MSSRIGATRRGSMPARVSKATTRSIRAPGLVIANRSVVARRVDLGSRRRNRNGGDDVRSLPGERLDQHLECMMAAGCSCADQGDGLGIKLTAADDPVESVLRRAR